MKKILIILLLVLIPMESFAQDDKTEFSYESEMAPGSTCIFPI